MVNLFHAGMGRLWKDKILWACTGAYFVFSAYYMWSTHRDLLASGGSWPLDNLFFASLPYYAVACAVFVSLFVGTEYADGTLRNKIIVGHARWEVYLSTYLVCLAGNLVILSGWLAGELTGIFYFGFWQAPAHQLFLTAGCLVLMSAALTGLLVLFSLSFTNRDVTAVGAVLLATALLMTASLLYNRLSEPEINSASVVVHENGQMEQLPPRPQPLLSGRMAAGGCPVVPGCLSHWADPVPGSGWRTASSSPVGRRFGGFGDPVRLDRGSDICKKRPEITAEAVRWRTESGILWQC